MIFDNDDRLREKIKNAYAMNDATDEQKARIVENVKTHLDKNNASIVLREQKAPNSKKGGWLGLHKKIVFVVSMIIVLFSIGGILLFMDWDKSSELTLNTYYGSQYQTINDADKYISFAITSVSNNLQEIKQAIAIKDYLGNHLEVNLSSDEYIHTINPPANGYDEGATYDIQIDKTKVSFAEQEISHLDKVSFTIKRPNIVQVDYKNEVKTINNTPVVVDDIDMVATIDGTDYDINEVVIINVDDGGFYIQKAYKIVEILDIFSDKTTVKLTEPQAYEVFNELNVKGKFEAEFNENTVKFYPKEQIEEELANSNIVQEIMSQVDSELRAKLKPPKISVELDIATPHEIKVGIALAFTVELSGENHEFSFSIKLNKSIRVETIADIDIWQLRFHLGAEVSVKDSFEIEYGYSKEINNGLSDLDDWAEKVGNLQKFLDNYMASDSDQNFKFFDLYIPTPIVVLGFKTEGQFAVRLKFEVTLTDTTELEQTFAFGIKKDSDGLSAYQNYDMLFSNEITLEGSVELKIGAKFSIYASLAGVLNAGVDLEFGGYARLKGFISIKDTSNLSNSTSFALFLEIGLYAELSLTANVDLILWKAETKITVVGIEFAIFSAGYTEMIWLEADSDSLVLSNNGLSTVPQVSIMSYDMFDGGINGEPKQEIVPKEKLQEYFDITTGDHLYIENGNVGYIGDETAQWEEKVELQLKQNVFALTPPKNQDIFAVGEPKRGVIHYELGRLWAKSKINVTKQPIAIKKIDLSFERVLQDSEYANLHPELGEDELQYNYREDIDPNNKDYQIGRLIKVVPTIYPSNASYKSLVYNVTKGENYIVGGKNGLKIYTQNGLTYAEFRVIYDNIAIEQKIEIVATSNGYTGEYSSWNIDSTTTQRVVASSIPVINYELVVAVGEENIKQTTVVAGGVYQFRIDNGTVFPKNATRGKLANENIRVVSGNASIDLTFARNNETLATIQVSEKVQVGEQIVVGATLGSQERFYYLNVVKRAVETITLLSSSTNALPNSSIDITAEIRGIGGGVPTINEALYIISKGKEIATIRHNVNDKNKITVDISKNAKNGDIIEIFAIVDGQKSEIIKIIVDKISVKSIDILSNKDPSLYVVQGEEITFASIILPTNATFSTPFYYIESGKEYASIDSITGIMTIGYNCRGGEQIIVGAFADDKYAETLTYTVVDTPVEEVSWENSVTKEYIKNNQIIILSAFVNPNATNQSVSYTIFSGLEYATIIDNQLVIKDALSGSQIVIRATANGNKAVYIDKTFEILSDINSISIDGKYRETIMIVGSTGNVAITDSQGNVLDSNASGLTYQILDQNENSLSNLAAIKDGILTINNDISPYEFNLNFRLVAEYAGQKASIMVRVVALPNYIELALKENNAKELVATRGEVLELALNINAPANASPMTNLVIEIDNAIYAYSSIIVDTINGTKVYRIFIQVSDTVPTSSQIQVKARYIVETVHMMSEPFVITVQRKVQSVEITNAPSTLGIGTSLELVYKANVEDDFVKPLFGFADTQSSNFATLDSTGLLNIKNNTQFVGQTIKVFVTLDGIRSKVYDIKIGNPVSAISIASAETSKNVKFIAELGFYVVYPNGRFEIDTNIIGGDEKSIISYYLQNYYDNNGQPYFVDQNGNAYVSSTQNIFYINSKANINNGINVTLVAEIDGVSSEPLVIYVPTFIKTVDDWFGINNNINGYFVLANDIYFTDTQYTPIKIFNGIIDGAGYSLRDINISTLTLNNNASLIEENYGMIIDLSLKQLNIIIQQRNNNQSNYIGGFAARNYGYIVDCNVVSTGLNMIYVPLDNTYVGGIAGLNDGTITTTNSNLYIYGTNAVGGIVGINTINGKIKDSQNYGEISVLVYEKDYVGIAGKNQGEINNCTNNGKIFDRTNWEYISKVKWSSKSHPKSYKYFD